MDTDRQYSYEERRQYREACEQHAAQLEERINSLFWGYHLDAVGEFMENVGWITSNKKTFWDDVKEINGLFNTLRPLRRYDQDRLHDKLSDAVGRVKRILGEAQWHSETRANTILHRLSDASSPASYGATREDIEGGFEVLRDVMEMIRAERLMARDYARVRDAYQDMRERMHTRRDTVQNENYAQLEFEVSQSEHEAYDDPYEALSMLREVQSDIHQAYLNCDQRQYLKDHCQSVWKIISQRINERKAEKVRKHDEWIERMEANIERWEQSKQHKEETIDNLERQINDLESQIWSSNSDSFIDRAQGWIEEKRDIIRSLEEKIDGLQRRIDEVLAKIDGR